MSRVAIFFADGFEEVEGLTVVDLLRRALIEVDTVSISEARAVQGSHKITIQTDMILDELETQAYDMLILPGGMPGTKNLGACSILKKALLDFHAQGKNIAAICAAPSVLGEAGILKGKKACCYPGFEEKLDGADVVFDAVVVDGHIITSRGVGTAIPFAIAIIEQMIDLETAQKIKTSIVYE